VICKGSFSPLTESERSFSGTSDDEGARKPIVTDSSENTRPPAPAAGTLLAPAPWVS
jgi:hypothetical protein